VPVPRNVIHCAWHAPAVSLQTPVSHWSVSAEQSRGIPPPQTPAVHVSPDHGTVQPCNTVQRRGTERAR